VDHTDQKRPAPDAQKVMLMLVPAPGVYVYMLMPGLVLVLVQVGMDLQPAIAQDSPYSVDAQTYEHYGYRHFHPGRGSFGYRHFEQEKREPGREKRSRMPEAPERADYR
jgi:hypothetical protein